METSDVLIVGGGVAGLSAAAAIAPHLSVTVLEAEDQPGYHSSGRSATMVHYALGDRLIRDLTLASRSFFDSPPAEFDRDALGRRIGVLVHARADELPTLEAVAADIAPFASLEWIEGERLADACPLLRTGDGGAIAGLLDPDGVRMDQHVLMQGYARQLRASGGRVVTGARIAAIDHGSGTWTVTSERGERFAAPILVNAAGAWADAVARLAGVRTIGLAPLRRTIIVVDGPPGFDTGRLPFTKTVGDELYFGPEAGRIFASPMDETPTDPCDAQPDDLDMALAAHRLEQRTTLGVQRIAHRWAGLRSFAPDRHPVVGFAPDAPDFFWLAGQGGAGLQTSPAMAAIAASLIAARPWPVSAVDPADLGPGRLLGQGA